MDRIATIISGSGIISMLLDGKSYIIDNEHPNYDSIKEAMKAQDADLLLTLVDIPRAVTSYAGNNFEIIDGVILYKGEEVHNTITQRVLELMAGDFPFEFMLRFLENLLQNPSARAVNELYDFLENKGLPITEDGCFLSYKGIQEDWTDRYTGTIDNSVGTIVEFPRNKVDDNRENTCSFGLHAGALSYVKSYCTERVVIVKINPADVVSVPKDHDAQKIRVCKYEVLKEITDLKDLDRPVYSADGSEFIPPPQDEDYMEYETDEDDPCYNCDDDCDECDRWD